MKLWIRLYLVIWLAFSQFFVNSFSNMFGILYLHIIFGLVIFVLAIINYRDLMKTSVPNRVKRISKTIIGMTAFDGVLGILLFIFTGTMHWMINLLHLVVSLAVITQASSAATAYDMWEEKEFS